MCDLGVMSLRIQGWSQPDPGLWPVIVPPSHGALGSHCCCPLGHLSRPVDTRDPHLRLQEGGQRLWIPDSHLGDEGRYQCVAFSPAGQQARDFQLRILGELHHYRVTPEESAPAPEPTRALPRSPQILYNTSTSQLSLWAFGFGGHTQ